MNEISTYPKNSDNLELDRIDSTSENDTSKNNSDKSLTDLLIDNTASENDASKNNSDQSQTDLLFHNTTTETSTNENNNSSNSALSTGAPKLILLGFGGFDRPLQQRELITIIVFFKRILGEIPSNNLIFPIDINHLRILRLLEKIYTDCVKETEGGHNNIQYNFSALINQNENSYTISADTKGLVNGNGDKVDYTVSSLVNQTKNEI